MSVVCTCRYIQPQPLPFEVLASLIGVGAIAAVDSGVRDYYVRPDRS